MNASQTFLGLSGLSHGIKRESWSGEDYLAHFPYSPLPPPWTPLSCPYPPPLDRTFLLEPAPPATGPLQWSVAMVTSPPASPTPLSPPYSPAASPNNIDCFALEPTSTAHHHPQQQHQAPPSHLVYYFTALPEKAKPIWAVFYDRRDHPLDSFFLQLFVDIQAPQDGSPTSVLAHTLPVAADISWRASNNEGSLDVGLIQYKIAFTCPNDTFQRAIFRAHLVNSATGLYIDLGVMSIVSTTNQRSDQFMAKLERRCPSEAHRRLVANFKRHPRKMRHFINGKGRSKGAKQASRRGHRFLMEEYVWAIHL